MLQVMGSTAPKSIVRHVLGAAAIVAVAVLTCACKASGHVDFELDLPAARLVPADEISSAGPVFDSPS